MTDREEPEPGTRAARGEIEITAPAEQVWRALTDARELERWFPLDARVEPGPEGTIWMSWRNEFQAESKILLWDPPRHLRTSWSFHEDDLPAQVTDYMLEARGGKTFVRVVTSGFPADAAWDDWVEGTNRGWAFELRSLKHYLERHPGQDRQVVYLRRRVPLSKGEAWTRLAGSDRLRPWLGGRPFDARPPAQIAAIVDDPRDAMFRASVEPGGPTAQQREVTLWLSAWGEEGDRLNRLAGEWGQLLEELYPDGVTP